GQYYCISLSDNDAYGGIHTSTLAIMFHDDSHRRLALNYWRFWLGQQREPENARALEVNSGRCSGIQNIQSDYFDRVTFDWHGKRGAKIYVRFNCLSTDFSRIKGVKGIPLRLHMETQGIPSPHEQQQSLMEATYCRIKLFRDKGAERKNKDDQRHIEKQLEKLQGMCNPGEAHPLLNALRREIKYTAFSDIAEELSPPVMSSVALEQNYSNTTTAERFKSSTCKPSFVFSPTTTPTSSSSSSPSSALSTPPSSTNVSPAVDGVDPNYVPTRRRRHAVLSLFVRCPNDEYYRAIYLDELTVQNLIDKFSTKLNVPVPIKSVIRHVPRHDMVESSNNDHNIIAVRVDDAMIRDIPEQQDMEIEIKFTDDGVATLILCY
ncbi:CP2 transcription factor-domain-containing protein, partial [Phascolomyces articulosus]